MTISSSVTPLKSFYLSVNQNNTYLNQINVNNESVIYQLLQRILTQNNDKYNIKSHKTMINTILSKFKFYIKASESLCKASHIEYGCYKITQNNKNDIIHIYGSNIPSIISGLSYYLSTYWMVSLSWNGNNINCLLDDEYLNNVIDNTPNKISIYSSRNFQYTYYKNPCTDSYSMVWWDWNRWQQELDWMLLNNINLLLLPTLNELIEYQLYTTYYKLNDEELNTYFVGPAFLAWFRMGNLRNWPPYNHMDNNGNKHRKIGLSQHWLKQQLILSYKIIARCIEFGIDIIFPGFSGHVPTQFTKHINAKFYDGSRWFGMPPELTHLKFLDATDDIYVDIGLKYQKIQYDIISSFIKIKYNKKNINDKGTTIFLWLDQFNELTPTSSELQYLQKCGENQLRSLQLKEYYDIATSSESQIKIKWTIQGWMFVHMRKYWNNQRIKHYFKGIGSDDILILDLIAEKGSIAKDSQNFFKHDYIWCFLHNFGGGHGLSGNLKNIFQTLSKHKPNANWKGIGISMEGIHNNPMLYHGVLYHSFTIETEKDLDASDKMDLFVTKYISSRYGDVIYNANNNEILQIWKELYSLIYQSEGGKWGVTRSLILKHPRKGIVSGSSEFKFIDNKFKEVEGIKHNKGAGFQTTLTDYPVCQLFVIWDKLMLFVDGMITNDKYKDVIFKSHTLSNDIAEITRQLISDIFQQIYLLLMKDESDELNKRLQDIMLGIIDDTDIILADFDYFRLDSWINNARKFGKDKEEKDYLELNARNLITRWGPNGEINDYSSREWNGLMSDYYKIRWKTFFNGGNINKFEKKWQYNTIHKMINVNGNSYKNNGNYQQFYQNVFEIYEKYKVLIDCNV